MTDLHFAADTVVHEGQVEERLGENDTAAENKQQVQNVGGVLARCTAQANFTQRHERAQGYKHKLVEESVERQQHAVAHKRAEPSDDREEEEWFGGDTTVVSRIVFKQVPEQYAPG
jgi:hypothetical protein